jgi:hypothetical protein
MLPGTPSIGSRGCRFGVGKRQAELVNEALRRAHAEVEAGADCVFPIVLWERDALASFLSDAPGPVNVLQIPPAPWAPGRRQHDVATALRARRSTDVKRNIPGLSPRRGSRHPHRPLYRSRSGRNAAVPRPRCGRRSESARAVDPRDRIRAAASRRERRSRMIQWTVCDPSPSTRRTFRRCSLSRPAYL